MISNCWKNEYLLFFFTFSLLIRIRNITIALEEKLHGASGNMHSPKKKKWPVTKFMIPCLLMSGKSLCQSFNDSVKRVCLGDVLEIEPEILKNRFTTSFVDCVWKENNWNSRFSGSLLVCNGGNLFQSTLQGAWNWGWCLFWGPYKSKELKRLKKAQIALSDVAKKGESNWSTKNCAGTKTEGSWGWNI